MTSPAAAPTSPVAKAMPRRTGRTIYAVLTLLLGLMLLFDVGMSESDVAQEVTPGVVVRVLASHVLRFKTGAAPVPANLDIIVWNVRLPKAIGGMLVGMLLALAGVAFQSFLQNPLADPYMIGVSSGAALGSVSVILLGGAGLLGGLMQTFAAFGTGLLATGVVYGLARRDGRLSAQTFLLAGIVVGTFLWSLIPLALSRSGSFDRQSLILSQLLGSLQNLGWERVGLLLPFGIVGALVLGLSARELNLLTLGEESAAQLGLNTEQFKLKIILAGAFVTAAAVSVAGIVAFVGLVVPHIARRLVGPDHRILLPASLLLGGLVLVAADWLSRVFLGNLEIGVVTSLFGAPVFCVLLRRRFISRGKF